MGFGNHRFGILGIGGGILGFVGAVLGAMLLLWIYRIVKSKQQVGGMVGFWQSPTLPIWQPFGKCRQRLLIT